MPLRRKGFKSSASEDLLVLIPVFAGAVSVLGRKQWRELDGRVRRGDKRGAAAPGKGAEAPPGRCSVGREATKAAATVVNPDLILREGNG